MLVAKRLRKEEFCLSKCFGYSTFHLLRPVGVPETQSQPSQGGHRNYLTVGHRALVCGPTHWLQPGEAEQQVLLNNKCFANCGTKTAIEPCTMVAEGVTRLAVGILCFILWLCFVGSQRSVVSQNCSIEIAYDKLFWRVMMLSMRRHLSAKSLCSMS